MQQPTFASILATCPECIRSATASVPKFSFEGTKCAAKCVKVYDGDSFHFAMNFHGAPVVLTTRLFGVDTPEVRGPSRVAGLVARDFVRSLILDQVVVIHCGAFDKYGRVLVNVFYPGQDGQVLDLASQLIAARLAVPYFGGTKAQWPQVCPGGTGPGALPLAIGEGVPLASGNAG